MLVCKNCGEKNDINWKFCKHCGKIIENSFDNTEKIESEIKERDKIIIILFIIIIILFIIGIISMKKNIEQKEIIINQNEIIKTLENAKTKLN